MLLRTYLRVSGIIFCTVGTLHFLRLFTGWEVVISGWVVPVWLSIFGVLLAWYLSYSAFALERKIKGRK